MKYLKYSVCLSFMLLLTACQSTRSVAPTSQTTIPTLPQSQVIWSRFIGNGNGKDYAKLETAASNQQLIVMRRSGQIFGLNLEDGHTQWQANLPYPITTPPSIHENQLFFVTAEPKLIALQADTGQPIWSAQLKNAVLAKVAVAKEQIIVKTVASEVLAYHRYTGKKLWEYSQETVSLMLRISSAAQIQKSQVFVGFPNGKLVALDVNQGTLLWEKALTTPQGGPELTQLIDIAADPLVFQDTIYVTTYQGQLSALSTYTGRISWQQAFSSYTGLTLGQHLYLTDTAGIIWALNAATGQHIWKQTALQNTRLTAAVIGSEGTLLIANDQGNLYWISQINGQLLAQAAPKIKSPILTSPIVQQDKVYIITNRGQIIAWKTPTNGLLNPNRTPLTVTR